MHYDQSTVYIHSIRLVRVLLVTWQYNVITECCHLNLDICSTSRKALYDILNT